MNTPVKEPALRAPILGCTVIVEHIAPAGTVRKSVSYKHAKLILGRNEFRDIILRLEGPKETLKFAIKEVQLHKRFMKEGKATIFLKDVKINLMLSNAPPNQLLVFMRTLASKQAIPEGKAITARQRLLSTAPNTFDEISPLTFKEYESLRQSGKRPLKEKDQNTTNASPLSSKRRKSDKGGSTPTSKVPRFLNPIVLSADQKKVLEAVHKGHNVFFTGSAGTGKSFLLKRIVGALAPDVTFVTASTGVAACQIGGTTLHAFAGIGNGDSSIENCISLASKRVAAQQWRKCKHLIVDEISMVDGIFFKKLEAVARAVRGNDKPFGGIQLILCGDFLQLPPVTKPGEKRVFCFQTSAWEKSIDLNMELTFIRRQNDLEFISILQSIRLGRCTEDMVDRLKLTETNVVEKDGIKATRLCTHREDVNHINNEHLNKLTGKAEVFQSIDSDPGLSKMLDTQTPVVSKLILKVGAQVMLMKNLDLNKGLVNGARGVVTGFKAGEGYPIVRFVCGITTEINHEKWTVKGGGGIYLTRRQFPLKLAWAFSIHKSQGMTLDCAEMSLSRVFECGQAYVALSRAKNLNSIRVLDFNPTCVRAHPDVLKFYQELRQLCHHEQKLIDEYV
ncbi:ATP-dependent DNA helicase PIF1 [Palaemon carinicauda]|uniref:ATP-dependent DNA helicase PIF1 n=1 Tax=Palaemon carinicauda TaxID=392227 RepID=UPI0035B59EA5